MIIFREDFDEEFVFFFRLCFEHVLAVMGIEEELSGLRVRDELNIVIVA